MLRRPIFSGYFYPQDKYELKKQIKFFFDNIDSSINKKINGIIVPHAGYMYSGKTAAFAYKLLSKKYKRVIVLGPTHTSFIYDGFCDEYDFWETPLGNVKISSVKDINKNCIPHENEHSIEVQVPFLQYVLDDFDLIPIVVGSIDSSISIFLAEKIAKELDNETLLVISTDLSHFNENRMAEKLDKKTIANIKNLNLEDIDACGINPLKVFFEIAKIKKFKPELLDYSTSADSGGDSSSVVGYASFWF